MSAPPAPRVSVCIANYNGEAMLADCIDSVMAQETNAAIEILVHDDASTDASVALLRQCYPQVRLIAADENVGFCIANNRMANAAKGDFVLLLNNDAALFPDAIRTLLAAAERRATPAILSLPQFDWASGELVDRGCLLDPLHTPIPNLDPKREDVAYVIGACLWIPRTTWNALGGFPEWFGSIAEDMYLCLAARLQGIPVQCTHHSGYRHRQGASLGGNRIGDGRLQTRYARRYLSERNRIAVIAACVPTPFAWLWLGLHLAGLLLEALAMCLISRSTVAWRKIYWPTLRDSAARQGNIHDLRHATQAKRLTGLASYLRVFSWKPQKVALFWRHGLPELKG